MKNAPLTESGSPELDLAEKGEEDEIVPLKERMKLFFTYHWRGLAAFIIPIILLPIVLPDPKPYQWCAYCLCVMAFYWVTECVALPVTSFLPLVIFPLTNVMDTNTVCMCYFNNTVIMFLGSLFLAFSVEQSGLHKRIAFGAIRLIGYSHYRLLFALSFITMFISMWLTNTAATTMMVPINFALLRVFEDQGLMRIFEESEHGDFIASDLTACYFCAITYSASLGGIGTLVGTATNLAFKGLFESAFPSAPEVLSFPKFSAFTIPVMLLSEACLYFWLILMYFGYLRPSSKDAKAAIIPPEAEASAKATVERDTKALGSITFWEIMVLILFSFAIAMFFCSSPQLFYGWADATIDYFGANKKMIGDSATAMGVCFLMLLLPSTLDIFKNFTAENHDQLTKEPIPSVIGWREMSPKIPYSFAFLLGGGFALSTAATKQYTDLNERIGEFLAGLSNLPYELNLLIVISFTTSLTNIASNVAVANVVVPIAMALATRINQNPLLSNLGCGLSASYCFMLPVGTPGNLIVQSAANIPTKKMIIIGSMPTLTTALITWAALLLYAPLIWPTELTGDLPEWATTIANGTQNDLKNIVDKGGF